MKRLLLLVTIVSLTLSSFVTAATFGETGLVSKIRAHQLGLGTNWVTVEGFTSAGSCTTVEGLIKLQVPDNERGEKQLSLLLAAKMAGQEVYVNTDDATGPNCLLRYVDLL